MNFCYIIIINPKIAIQMKNLVLLPVLFFITLTSTFAQSDSKAIQLGVKGGVNFSTITSDDFDDLKSIRLYSSTSFG